MLKTTQPLVFIGERKGESKSGNAYQFIKLANPKTFENYEMFAEGVSVTTINKGDLVHAELDLNSGYGKTNISVLSINSAVK